MKRCAKCNQTADQGSWPDGPRWCSATIDKPDTYEHDQGEDDAARYERLQRDERVHLCPNCCACTGQGKCGPAPVLLIVLLAVA